MSKLARIMGASSAALAVYGFGGAALAQTNPPPQQTSTLDEIVVTAQRRSENQQRVPVAITTLTAEAIENAGVSSTDALLQVTPGLVITKQTSGSQPFIRGVGSLNTGAGDESSVSTYVDGVYYMSPNSTVFSFNNITRIEVLRGPQGTLFGRNATGGLLNVITRDPDVARLIKGSISYANYDTFESSLYATGGSGDVAADIAGYAIRQRKGFGRNLITHTDTQIRDQTSLRSKLLWKPTDQDRLILSADWTSNQTTIGLDRSLRALGSFNTVPTGGPFDSQSNVPGDVLESNYWGASARYEHTFGWGTLSSLTAYRNLKQGWRFDSDNTPVALVAASFHERTKTFQQEILGNGKLGRLDWTAGLFYFHATSQLDPLSIRSSISPPNNLDRFTEQVTNSYAAFAQGAYALTDLTKITAGIRYTVDEREFQGQDIAAAGNSAPVGSVLVDAGDRSKRFPKVTWRLAVDQQLSDRVMAYASYSRGFKSGVFNSSNLTQPVVAPEVLDAIEVGLKSQLLDNTLRLNVSAFAYNYTDIQLFRVNGPITTLFNAAEGKLSGLELEATYAPRLDHIDLKFSSAVSVMTKAEYKSFPVGPVSVPNPAGGNIVTVGDLSGNHMIRAPDWTLTLGVDLSVPVGAGAVGFNLNYYYNDGFFWEADNRTSQNSYDVVNGQIFYDFGNEGQYRVKVFGKNLGDTVYSQYQQQPGAGDNYVSAAPRTFGIGMDFSF